MSILDNINDTLNSGNALMALRKTFDYVICDELFIKNTIKYGRRSYQSSNRLFNICIQHINYFTIYELLNMVKLTQDETLAVLNENYFIDKYSDDLIKSQSVHNFYTNYVPFLSIEKIKHYLQINKEDLNITDFIGREFYNRCKELEFSDDFILDGILRQVYKVPIKLSLEAETELKTYFDNIIKDLDLSDNNVNTVIRGIINYYIDYNGINCDNYSVNNNDQFNNGYYTNDVTIDDDMIYWTRKNVY